MKKFQLSAQVTITAFTTIEAETTEEAIEKAKERSDMMQVYPTGCTPDDVWMIDEIDGSPFNIKVIR